MNEEQLINRLTTLANSSEVIADNIKVDKNIFKEAIELIDKLQKENKYLREREEYLEKRRSDIINKFQNEVTDTTIPKNKIKEALGDKNIHDDMILTYIETLASENNRLEDIEDRKVQIEYNKVFNKGVKSVEDKIRDKINQIDEEYSKTLEKELSLEFHNINAQRHDAMKIVLEELLGE